MRELEIYIIIFTSNSIIHWDSIELGQVMDHGLMFEHTGWPVLKKTFYTFGSLTTLTILFSLRSNSFCVSLKTFISFGQPRGDLLSFYIGPGFSFMSPSISSCKK